MLPKSMWCCKKFFSYKIDPDNCIESNIETKEQDYKTLGEVGELS